MNHTSQYDLEFVSEVGVDLSDILFVKDPFDLEGSFLSIRWLR